MTGSRDAALGEFYAEADEVLQRVSALLSQLEAGEVIVDGLGDLYRDIHSIKGSAQLFGLTHIARVAHVMESCLEPVRDRQRVPSARMVDALFGSLILIERLVEAEKSHTQSGVENQIDPMLARLIEVTALHFGSEFDLIQDTLLQVEEPLPISEMDKKLFSPRSSLLDGASSSEDVSKDESTSILNPVSVGALNIESTLREYEPEADPVNANADSTIRVQVGVLDNLMNLVGEMVLVRNQVLQHSGRSEDLEFLNLSQRLDAVTTELQDQVMRTRMQPIGNILSKFQRMVRDLSRDLGKRIDLTMQGRETELDKTLLEAIKDPLTHIVRNACDHGVELPAVRARLGKPENGHISIRAYHEGGQVIVEISDDGAGLNRKRIVAKAIERGFLSPDGAEKLSDRERLQLIFHPGLSTSEQVTSVSGRGVGMDVVRTNIERIGGSVELDSIEGRGSTVRLRIPLTLAIVPAMLVRSDCDEYAIPQVKLVELVRVDMAVDQERRRIQNVQGKPVYELRGKLLPLVDLSQVLSGHARPMNSEAVSIVVLNAEGEWFGLIVDEILDTADIVVKPLIKFLKSLDVFSAATILGSGRVALILDPSGVAKAAHLALEKKASDSDFHSNANAAAQIKREISEYLLMRIGTDRLALPLAMVSRLEEFQAKHIEYAGEQAVVQYRQAILPLFSLPEVLHMGPGPTGAGELLPTIVIQRAGRLFGLIVDEILDVCTEDNSVDDSIRDRFGVLGNLLHGGEVIPVVDAISIIDREYARLSGESLGATNESISKTLGAKIRVLYAEDVGFFRRQVTRLLTGMGFEVAAAEDGKVALELLRAAGPGYFNVILSDIEMPNLTGLDLARSVRSDKAYKDVPLVALTTRFGQRDIDEGRQAGFDCYLEKLNPEALLENIQRLLRERQGVAA